MAGFQNSINRGIGALAGVATAAQRFGAGQSGAPPAGSVEQNAEIAKSKEAAKEARDRYEWETIRREHFEKKFEEITAKYNDLVQKEAGREKAEKAKQNLIKRRFDLLYGGVEDGDAKTSG